MVMRSPILRRALMLLWLLVPLGLVAWHYGPGQSMQARDQAGALVARAGRAASAEDWESAAALYAQAVARLPAGAEDARRRLDLEYARARMQAGQILEAQEDLKSLLRRVDETSPLAAAARHELASAHYFTAWLMRLEGATPEEWKPEAQAARQHFRLLAERAAEADAPDVEAHQRNLEATIRLEQMDLSELQAQPLPKKCPNCCQGLCRRKRKQSPGERPQSGQQEDERKEKGKSSPEGDIRQEIKKNNSAGLNERSGTGS